MKPIPWTRKVNLDVPTAHRGGKRLDRRSTKGRAQGANGEQRWPEVRVRAMRLDSWIDPVESHKRYPVRRWKVQEGS